jgi:O-antigen ligase
MQARFPVQTHSPVPLGVWLLVAVCSALLAFGPLETSLLVIGGFLALVYVGVAYKDLAIGLALFTFLTFYDTAGATVAPSLTFSKLAGMLLAAIWIVRVTTPGNRGPLLFRDSRLLASVTLLLAGWVLLATVWVPDFDAGLGEAVRLFQGIILVFVVFSAVARPRDVRLLTAAFVGGALLAAVLGLTSTAATTGDRISGGFDDPNELAAVAVPGMMLAGFGFLAFRGHFLRWAFAACVPILGLALLDSDSQGGLVALAVGAVAAVVFGGSARKVIAPVVASLLLLGVVNYALLTPSPSSALTEGGASREDLWKVAIYVAEDHPFVGVGPGGFTQVEPTYALRNLSLVRVDLVAKAEVAHNTYLNILTDYGIVGLGLLLALISLALLLGVRATWTFAKTGQRELELLARGAVVSLVAMLTAYTFISAQYEKQLWLLIGFVAALSSVAHTASMPSRSYWRRGTT